MWLMRQRVERPRDLCIRRIVHIIIIIVITFLTLLLSRHVLFHVVLVWKSVNVLITDRRHHSHHVFVVHGEKIEIQIPENIQILRQSILQRTALNHLFQRTGIARFVVIECLLQFFVPNNN